MLPPLVSSAARVLLLAASVTALLAACSPDPGARNHAARDRTAHATTPQGTWVRWKAYGDEASYLNTRYVSEGPPIVVEILDIWRPEPAFTYRIKDRRAFWCKEQEVALLGRWVSKNGAPFKKSELPEEMLRRK